MNRIGTLLLSTVFLLNACASAASQAAEPPNATEQPAANGIPYPEPDLHSQINHLGIRVARLENQIERLQQQIEQLEHRKRQALPAPVPYHFPTQHTPADSVQPQAVQTLREAQQQYRQGNYAAAAALLKTADGGNGDETARLSLYLLFQSHFRLGNCESAIQTGLRYANRFRGNDEAPEALYRVAECQAKMQQKDIARDTWSKLIQTYPESKAAKQAYKKLNIR
ncbi:TPA: tol-pal system YbgF family protein [Neisseria weaveri]